jgi:hypothetical protein
MKAIRLGFCAAILAFAAPIPYAFAQTALVNIGEAELIVGMPGLADAAAVAWTLSGTASGAAMGRALVEQKLIGNTVQVFDLDRRSVIDDAFLDNQGIVSVNQDSGDVNNQANVRVIALAYSGDVSTLQSTASTTSSGNTLITSGGSSEDRISGSFGGSSGLLGINQSSGSLNQQANVMLIGLGTSATPSAAQLADATLASVSGGSNNTASEGVPRPRSDVIDGSFTGFHGAAQISQSAGDMNTISNNMAIAVMPGVLP